MPKGEADASLGLTREMYKCLRGDRKSIGFDRGASTSGVHTSGFSTGPSQSRDVIQENHGVEIPVVDLRDGAPPVPGSNLPNISASAVPSGTGVVGRSLHPAGSD